MRLRPPRPQARPPTWRIRQTAAAAGASESDGTIADEPDPGPADPLHTPARGEAVAVVGVAFDDSVAVRRDPRPDAAMIAELAPLFDAAIGTGQGRTVGTTGWWRIRVGEQQGWVEASSMARLGATTDVTDDVIAALGDTPVAPTLRALGRLVARARIGDGEAAALVLAAAPRNGDGSEVVYDIVDRRDASIVGERLVVSAEPADDGEGFALRAVEATTFCARGVTADGRCT